MAKALTKKGKKVEGNGNTVGWAAKDESGHLELFKFERRAVGADDINIAITYAGICHRYAVGAGMRLSEATSARICGKFLIFCMPHGHASPYCQQPLHVKINFHIVLCVTCN